ncbi:hypothetical protein [Jeotgalicoccus saudimassiliensis]|uniref:hypothetical protein n=1 Tax=Jeotgalicoccus saudimassiliensis TaxID=1461582 RepID=UPI00056C47AB|nr:hypothetical protein [Jeotgalicoccus saudimassiliensis]
MFWLLRLHRALVVSTMAQQDLHRAIVTSTMAQRGLHRATVVSTMAQQHAHSTGTAIFISLKPHQTAPNPANRLSFFMFSGFDVIIIATNLLLNEVNIT